LVSNEFTKLSDVRCQHCPHINPFVFVQETRVNTITAIVMQEKGFMFFILSGNTGYIIIKYRYNDIITYVKGNKFYLRINVANHETYYIDCLAYFKSVYNIAGSENVF
jgi:hypothetical protein